VSTSPGMLTGARRSLAAPPSGTSGRGGFGPDDGAVDAARASARIHPVPQAGVARKRTPACLEATVRPAASAVRT
jgi:hypothetical protein